MKLICICGPTATGKTKLGVELALQLNGEIVSCDSMQLYRGMDIGTAKVTPEEMRGVPHHMLDVLEPEQHASVSLYTQLADKCISDITSRGKLPIVVGGTALYMDSLIKGDGFAGPAPNPQLRAILNAQASTEAGLNELREQLRQGDEKSFNKLHPNDKKRIVRAIEVLRTTGKPISEHDFFSAIKPPKYQAIRIILSCADRSVLYNRINLRVDQMIESGLECEVKHLLALGLENATSMQAIGYKEFAQYLRGECSFEDAVESVKRESRRYAKRQLTWLRRYTDCLWINTDEYPDFETVVRISTEYLAAHNVK